MKRLIKARQFMIDAILLSAILFSHNCLAGISVGGISGPLSLDTTWPPQAEYTPCWSPDGTEIAFAWGDGYTAWDPSLGTPNPDGSYIVIMTADGQAIRGPDNPLVNDVGWDNHSPDWSPDGNWIVYAGSKVGPAYIARISVADGTVVPILGTIGGHPKEPKWSPNGAKIAYRGGGYGGSPSYHICITDPHGSTHEDLTPGITGYGVTGLSWNPDGSKIVFTREGQSGLFILDVETKDVTPLPGFPSGLAPTGPVWASDEDSILFNAAGGIYCYQIGTQETEQLTDGPDLLGDWHSTAGIVFSSSRGCTVRWDTNVYIGTPGPANQPPIADAGPDQTVYVCGLAMLDGSASYDPDGDPLTHTWYLDGQTIATGVNPAIQLPAGVYLIDLVVNDGMEDSQPDQVGLTVVQTIGIDIYPNRVPNRVFLSRNYTLYAAVLGSASFDVTTLDSATVKFGRIGTEASPVRAPITRDLNSDGFVDVMYGFQTFDCGFQLGDTEGWLIGFTISGIPVEGVDSVLVSP
ncbi:MAG: TolB family protein [Planctomycetota bacterium]|jgi:Tol biopolymer transport system component